MNKLSVDHSLLKAKSLARKGKVEQARRIYQEILQNFPGNERARTGLSRLPPKAMIGPKNLPAKIINHLSAMFNHGQFAKVALHAERYLNDFHNNFFLWNIFGVANFRLGNLDRAEAGFGNTIQLNPLYPDAYNNLGVVLKERGRYQEARQAYIKATEIKPEFAEAHNNLGVVLKEIGKFDDARRAYLKAVDLKPDYAEAYNNLGNIHKALGEVEDAITAYAEAIKLKPGYGSAHRELSTIKTYSELTDPQLLAMIDHVEHQQVDEDSRCQLCFGLAKAYEDLGQFDKAFFYLAKGNASRKKALQFHINADKKIFAKIEKIELRSRQTVIDIDGKQYPYSPIFVLGMPRSGTTLVEQIIASHSAVQGAGELEYLKNLAGPLLHGQKKIDENSINELRHNYLEALGNLSSGKAYIIDKMPHNFLYIGLIRLAFPEARIIHVQRDAAATCWSNFWQYFSSKGLGYSYDLNDIIEHFHLYQHLMLFWETRHKGKIYHLDYDRLTEDQENQTKKLIRHLNLDWEDACLSPHKLGRGVNTASQIQVRQQLYAGSSQKWRKYEPFLNGIFDNLQNPSTDGFSG